MLYLNKITIICLFFLYAVGLNAQSISRVEPANWWTGMKWNTVTLLVYGKDLGDVQPTVAYKGVRLVKTQRVTNPNYLFVSLQIAPTAAPGTVKINFKKGAKTVLTQDFPLLAREKGSATRPSFTQKDAILLVVPDRFANGDPANDNTPGSLEAANRTDESGRHGGDIQGLMDHLDYIQALGFTQIWNTPLLENNMPRYSYHGYAATDFYKIDPRFGSNELFKTFVQEARKRNIGVIWDVVLNHCGLEYYFVQDPPSKDWLNVPDTRSRTNHLKSTLLDPYAAEQDKLEYNDGWFDTSMPDLNQKNPLLATYLIQNTIWWIEYAGLSGFREDTYSYADKGFLAKWSKTITDEYPNFNIVGEEMTTTVPLSAYWQKGKINPDGYKSYLPSLMDFALTENNVKSLTTGNGWFSTWREVYQGIAQDYQYPRPDNLLIFPDNHDLDRYYSRLNQDFDQWKLGMALFMTMRGIPQFFYGTELLMTNEKSGNDGLRRGDFYGGWPGDTKNARTGAGLSERERAAQQYFSRLLNWRKTATAVHSGKLKHYAPQRDDAYVYFRYTNTAKIMVILNKNADKITLDMARFQEMAPASFTAKEIIGGTTVTVNGTLEVAPKTAMILELE